MDVLLPQLSVQAFIKSRRTALSVTSFTTIKGVLVVMVIATLGAGLALQGWRSRIPYFDLLLGMRAKNIRFIEELSSDELKYYKFDIVVRPRR